MKKLDRSFYLRDTVIVARELLGKELVHEAGGIRTAGRIVETEAYTGPGDKGSHSYGGKRTNKNETMYHQGGTAYVYLIYGMYHCFNVVTEEAGMPAAVLIRAVEPVEGFEIMSQARYGTDYNELTVRQKTGLCNGPGKLCIAMDIGRVENGLDLCGNKLYIRDAQNEPFQIKSSPRINIDYAEEYRDKPWRFYIEGSRYVSKP